MILLLFFIRNEVTRKELGQEITLIVKIRKRRPTWFGT